MQNQMVAFIADSQRGEKFCKDYGRTLAAGIEKPSDNVFSAYLKCWVDLYSGLVSRYPSWVAADIELNLYNYLYALSILLAEQKISAAYFEASEKSASDFAKQQRKQDSEAFNMRLNNMVTTLQLEEMRRAQNDAYIRQMIQNSQQMMAPQGNPLLRCSRDTFNPSILNCTP